jgi:hypothetical protein
MVEDRVLAELVRRYINHARPMLHAAVLKPQRPQQTAVQAPRHAGAGGGVAGLGGVTPRSVGGLPVRPPALNSPRQRLVYAAMHIIQDPIVEREEEEEKNDDEEEIDGWERFVRGTQPKRSPADYLFLTVPPDQNSAASKTAWHEILDGRCERMSKEVLAATNICFLVNGIGCGFF